MRFTCDRSRIERALVLTLLCSALLGGGGESAGTDAASIERLVDTIQRRYDGVRDIRAHFVQTSWLAALGREETTRGHVLVKRPGRMRWEYEAPQRSVIAVDGDRVSVYMPDEKKLQIAPLDAGALSPTALGFLLGTAKLREVFRAEPLAETRPNESGVRLVPRQEAGFEALELWVDAESHELRESVLHDLFGNRTRIRFDDAAENQGVASEAFRIEVSEDTDVIDLR